MDLEGPERYDLTDNDSDIDQIEEQARSLQKEPEEEGVGKGEQNDKLDEEPAPQPQEEPKEQNASPAANEDGNLEHKAGFQEHTDHEGEPKGDMNDHDKQNMRIRLPTDCSGMEAPIMALDNLGIDYRHVFSSDIARQARRTIEANTDPEILFNDLKKRINSKTPAVDVLCGRLPLPAIFNGKKKGGI